jgi:hypothetical protein
MASTTYDMDMGDLGTNEVVIQYRTNHGLLIITALLWDGRDLIDYISPSVEDVLQDACRENESEELICAAESEWERKRDERRAA